MTRPPTLRRAALAGTAVIALITLLACSTDALYAHEWPSPAPGDDRVQHEPAPRPSAGGWSGTVWAGPEAGAPAAPNARHCTRPPRPFEIGAGAGWDTRQQIGMSRRGDLAPRERADKPSPSVLGKAAAPAAPAAMADALRAPAAAGSRTELVAGLNSVPRTRPVDEPVAAGVVDDNADFGEYLAYRERHAHLPVRARDVRERYGLIVHDARGRPVPDATVTVYAGAQALPLWARTDAAGHVWLHPSAAAVPASGRG